MSNTIFFKQFKTKFIKNSMKIMIIFTKLIQYIQLFTVIFYNIIFSESRY